MNMRVRATHINVVVILLLLATAAIGLGACGSDDPGGGSDLPTGIVATYTDDTYGFSFEYPANWTIHRNDEAQATAGASAVASVGAYDPKGAASGNSYYDLVEVSVYQLNGTVDDSVMSQIKEEVQATFAQIETQAGNWKATTELADVSLAGLKGWTVSYDFDLGGLPSKCTFYMLFGGTREYQLLLQASSENWEANKAVFDAFLAGFKPGTESPSTSATAPAGSSSTSG